MPLNAKGQEILSKMKEEYGEEKGKSVFYASVNSGKITGVDSANLSPGSPATGSLSSNPSSTVPHAQETKDQVMNLPTLDEFRKHFNDAVREGLPLQKCLDLGVTWGTGDKNHKWQGVKDCSTVDQKISFRGAIKDALKAGKSFTDAIGEAVRGK